jgi:molybdenum cofactor biosynthesis enzyme MoaA
MQLRHLTRQLLGPWLNRHPRLKEFARQTDTQLDLARHTAASVFPALIQPQPRNLTVALTAYCNLRCVGCRYGRDFMPGAQLPWEIARDLLTDARSAGFESVRLYGGEPLLYPELPQLVAHALQLGLRPYVTTNALLLDEKLDELYAAGLRDVTIGFYGVGAHYDAYVQRQNRFAKLSASLDAVRARYGSSVNLRLNWLLMRPSCSVTAVREAWDFAQHYQAPLQVDLIHYSLPYFTEGPERELQFRPEDRPAINAVVAELMRLKQIQPEMLDQSALGLSSIGDWLIKREAMRVPCDKYQMIWVGADGTVQMCYVDFKLGNLHQQRFREMLFTPAHHAAARAAFTMQCPNCHCSYDARIQKHLPSRRHYATQLAKK